MKGVAAVAAPAVLTINLAEDLDEHPVAMRFVIQEARVYWGEWGGRGGVYFRVDLLWSNGQGNSSIIYCNNDDSDVT